MDFLTLFIVLLVTVFLCVVIIQHWMALFFLWQGLKIVVGIVGTSWITAFILTFFNVFLTEKWEGFNTRWLYSGIFFTAFTVVYLCIGFNVLSFAYNFLRSLFKGR